MNIGEIQAIEPFVPRLRRFARALLDSTDEADDLVRDCLGEAVARRRQGEPVINLRVWLFGILHNCYLRRFGSGRERAACDHSEPAGTLGPKPAAGFTVRDFENAFRGLAVEDQEILLLIGLEGMSHREAAEVLGFPLGTLMLRLWQLRKRLRSVELRTNGQQGRTVRPRLRSNIQRSAASRSRGDSRQPSAVVIRLARH